MMSGWLRANLRWDFAFGIVGILAGVFGAVFIAVEHFISAEVCFILAGLTLVLWLMGRHGQLKYLLAVVLTGCFIYLVYSIDKYRIQTVQHLYAGRLSPQGIIDDGHLQPGAQIQIGRSHVIFMESVFPDALSAMKGDRLTIEKIDGKLIVSTMIRDSSGSVLAELRRNEWKVAPPPKTWDRNYADNALEVVNAEGYVVLQVKILENIVQLQGSWWVDLGPPNGKFRLVIREAPPSELQGNFSAQIIMCPPADAACGQIAPIFEYPSDLHLGELHH
jgi:hypothetical protein